MINYLINYLIDHAPLDFLLRPSASPLDTMISQNFALSQIGRASCWAGVQISVVAV